MENSEYLIEILKRHEGLRLFPYKCSAGKTTIGYGRNLTDIGISKSEAEILLVHDMETAMRTFEQIFSGHEQISKSRRIALTDMIFNLGRTRFLGFHKMLAAILDSNWIVASNEAKNSKWYRQVGIRGHEIVKLLRNG